MKALYKHILVMLLIVATGYTVAAQGNRSFLPDNRGDRQSFKAAPQRNLMPNAPGLQRLQNIKEAFLKKRLSLTTDEAQQFWPLYRQYQDEMVNVRRLKRLNNSDAQANGSEQVKKDLEYESQLVNLKKRYNDEFLKILPAEKVSLLYKSEREFNDEMINVLHERAD